MPRRSAGLIMYRVRNGAPELLLVHPGGPFWARKDLGAWSIPKGEYLEGEDPLQAARREFREETGHEPSGSFIELDRIRQPGGKLVRAWAFSGDFDPAHLVSNTFTMEWPPRSGRQTEFPEVDRACWFGIDEAREKILPGQLPLIDQVAALLRSAG
ncbi:NUDIX domain-containing protein [Geomonas sp. Red69]|uniref:NUDIX domain-containing protein n=1 Tax=Geomonas diazotrophica TaxID=2843197 RepID=UPI001C0FA7F4|nr:MULTISPECIES: NUDIX domain-containing protein [Geomonas]MBU5636918.1 NUDIX domain-containing protein [Geomonas diazotrophica]QXE87968.1 NUDIX domain-containing protein [Geomonas nitrogeniifigens]